MLIFLLKLALKTNMHSPYIQDSFEILTNI